MSSVARSSGSLRIRAFRADDVDAVSRITLSAYDAYGRMEGDYREYLADPQRRVDGATALLVAELDGEVVGTVTFVLPGDAEWEGRPVPDGDAGFRVLAVARGVEGFGVGRALVGHCIELAREHDCHRLIIATMEWMGRAQALYESTGFVRRADLDVRFPGGNGLPFTLDLTDDAPNRFAPPGQVPAQPPWFTDAWHR